ncbi:MAG: hypothetical protein ACK46X_07935, partial [Candidatus Sericytochromatia bacterium]
MSQTLPPQAPIPDLGPSSRRKRRRRSSLWARRAIARVVLVGGAAMLGGGFGAISRAIFKPLASATSPQAAATERANTLVIAVNPKPLAPEPGEKATRRVADGLYLLSLDSKTQQGYVLSMPRQTKALLGTNG